MRQRSFHPLASIVAAMLCVAGATPARAQGLRCVGELRMCFERAAFSGTFWGIWVAGLDCEVDFLGCARDGLIGR
jgi:hypothetical protein